MTSFFGGSKMPAVQPAPVTPAADPAAQAERDAAAEAERRRRMAGGRASNILTSPLGDTSTPTTSAAQLLGG